MNFKMIGKLLSQVLLGEAAFMLPALILEIVDQDFESSIAFVVAILLILAFSFVLKFLCHGAERGFTPKRDW